MTAERKLLGFQTKSVESIAVRSCGNLHLITLPAVGPRVCHCCYELLSRVVAFLACNLSHLSPVTEMEDKNTSRMFSLHRACTLTIHVHPAVTPLLLYAYFITMFLRLVKLLSVASLFSPPSNKPELGKV